MNHLFIINPTAGKNNDTKTLSEVIGTTMRKRGDNFEIYFTDKIGHATVIARDIVSDGGDWRVYACGGDGTLNEVLNGVAGFGNAALTQVAYGTGNDFLKLFNPDDHSRFRDIDLLADGEERNFDLIECAGRYSMNICSAGFDARVASDVHKFSKLPLVTGFGAFTISALYNLVLGLGDTYSVEVDGEKLDGDYALICVANARYYGGGYMPMGDSDPTDGVLDVLLIENMPRIKVPALMSKYKAGLYEELGGIRRAAHEVKIDFCGRTEAINIDGEILSGKGCSMKLSEHKQRFFAPRGSFDHLKCSNNTRNAEIRR